MKQKYHFMSFLNKRPIREVTATPDNIPAANMQDFFKKVVSSD